MYVCMTMQVLSVMTGDGGEGGEGGEEGEETVDGIRQAFVFLSVGDAYNYPITMGGFVPTLRVAPRSYVFPLADNSSFIGLSLPQDANPDAVTELELFLAENTDFRAQQPASSASKEAAVATTSSAATTSAPPPTSEEMEAPAPASAPATAQNDVEVVEIVPVDEAALVAALPAINDGTGEDDVPAGYVASTLGMVAGGIEGGSKMVGSGLVASAAFLGGMFRAGGSMLTSRIQPKNKPVEVSDGVRNKVRNVNHVSKAAVGVSSALVKGVRAMALSIGSSIAEVIGETGVGKKFGSGSDSNPSLRACKEVVVNAVVAVDTLHTALADAGRILLTDIGGTTVAVVSHRYGDEVGEVTGESLQAVGNVIQAGTNVRKIGVKAMTVVATKSAAKGVLTGERQDVGEDGKPLLPLAPPSSSSDGGMKMLGGDRGDAGEAGDGK